MGDASRSILTFALIVIGLMPVAARAQGAPPATVRQAIDEAERATNARIGVAVLDAEAGRQWSYRGGERFALTSTFKAFACAALLARAEGGQIALGELKRFSRSDLVTYSPVTQAHADGPGLSLDALCAATLRTSDNTAGNLVLDAIGGPGGFTAFMRQLGDGSTRLDRRETSLNEAVPGDIRDTTTPDAAAASLQRLVAGDALSATSRGRLTNWMAANEVAGPLLRSVLPEGWRIADRSGAGGHGARAIVAALWPPGRGPVVVAIYVAETSVSMDERNKAIAIVGRAVVDAVARN
jgi:beta-lactamase class A